jgi:hypothetical protein
MLRELAQKRVFTLALMMALGGNVPRAQADGGEALKHNDLSGIIAARAVELETRIQQRMQDRLQRQLEGDRVNLAKMRDRDDLAEMSCGIDFEQPVAALGE